MTWIDAITLSITAKVCKSHAKGKNDLKTLVPLAVVNHLNSDSTLLGLNATQMVALLLAFLPLSAALFFDKS